MKKLIIVLVILFFLSSIISAFFFFNSGVFDFEVGHVTKNSIKPVVESINSINFLNLDIPLDSEKCFDCLPKG